MAIVPRYQKANRFYVDGMGLRRTGCQLGVPHQRVANWAKEHSEKLPKAPVPEEVKTVEFDELFTFIGEKKRIYLITLVDRETRCILSWKVACERAQSTMQAIGDEAPKAKWHFSDGLEVYTSLWYHFGR